MLLSGMKGSPMPCTNPNRELILQSSRFCSSEIAGLRNGGIYFRDPGKTRLSYTCLLIHIQNLLSALVAL